ncbi:MAG: DUF5115 domain-containing protein [Prevotella sp.]|nr:DUF5115 domain-containing protein [Prevotella sp.]
MKNLFKYTLAACAGLVLASCNGDYDDWAQPQTNGEEEAITIPGYSVASTQTATIDLAAQTEDSISIFTLAEASNLPAGARVEKNTVELTPSGDGQLPTASMKVVNADLAGKVSVAELQKIAEDAYGKRPVARTFKAQVYSRVNLNGDDLLIDAGQFTLTVVPQAPFIAENYYVVGGPLDWFSSAQTKELKFEHSALDVYEDPIFTITIPTSGDSWFAIGDDEALDAIANDNVWNKLFGTTGKSEDLSGKLDYRYNLGGDYSLHVSDPSAKFIVITLNMMERTYEIKTIGDAPKLFLVGGLTGWSPDNAAKALLIPESNTVASYVSKYSGAWDLKLWKQEDLGNWDNCWGCKDDGCADPSGAIITSGSQAISAPSAEYYIFTVNTATMQYTWTRLDNQNPTEYTLIGLIGGFNSWGSDLEMTQVTPHNWYAEATFDGATELKFRANGGWDVNWGAAVDTSNESYFFGLGTQNGPNISVPAGSYKVFFNDITGRFAFLK